VNQVLRRRLGRLTIAITAAALAVMLWWVWHWQLERVTNEARRHADSRLALYSSSLNGALERFTYLPGLLARHSLVQAAVVDEVGVFTEQVNRYLAHVAESSGAEAIFLMDDEGVTIAASNYASDASFLGHHYDFRPYFQDAMAEGQGEFFAIGSTTGRAGYFVSAAVQGGASGRPGGVLVVKISLEALQDSWRQAGEQVLLSDTNGVVILSSRPEWRYRRLDDIGVNAMEEIHEQRQFLKTPLRPLGERLPDGSLHVGDTSTGDLGERYLDLTLPQTTLDWTMHYLLPVRPLYTVARNALLAASGTTLALLLLGLWLRERQKRQRLRDREARIIQEANERLEARVKARTQELEAAQAELVQAGKLAALGTMAAGIAHELNQPLAGIRTYAVSGARLLERGREATAIDNFRHIHDLSDRLATLIRQLKIFARKGGTLESVDLVARLQFVLELLRDRLERQKVELHLELPEDSTAWVAGDSVRIEQLLTNLLRNALDALRDTPSPRLDVRVDLAPEQVELVVADNGPGIDEATLEHIFDPFYTTKEVGDGLGLGLFIAYGIVQDLKGRIRAENRPAHLGGAVFHVILTRVNGESSRQPGNKDIPT